MTPSAGAIGPRLWRRLALAVCYAPPVVLAFVFGDAGRTYGIGRWAKLRLTRLVLRNARAPGSASSFLEQLTLVAAVLAVPKEDEGHVAEFGCYKGLSSASLSLACAATGRRLVVFDSFQGLPAPAPDEPVSHIASGNAVAYEAGDYAGSLAEVSRNIERYGDLSVCELVRGFFGRTLPTRSAGERYVLIFEDADLPASVRDVLRFAWPKLRPGGVFYTHEARDLQVVRLFFDDGFWHSQVGTPAPGLVGSGLGLTFAAGGSCLAYAVKAPGVPSAASSS